MNCKLCGKELGLFGKVQVEDGFICKDCNRSMTEGTTRWGKGIPKYKHENLMDNNDFIQLAGDAVKSRLGESQGLEIIDEDNSFAGMPYYLCTRNGQRELIASRLYKNMDEINPMPYLTRRELMNRAAIGDAKCYYVDVIVKAKDPIRCDRRLYLKNDDYEITVGEPEIIESKVHADWIKKTLDEIELLNPEREKEQEEKEEGTNTGLLFSRKTPKYSKELRPEAKFSLSEKPALQQEYSRFVGMGMPKTFQEELLDMISEKGLTNSQFYNAAMIDRKLFSSMKNNRFYRPKKETAVACCFGLRLGLKESEQLLEAAGYKLSLAIPWDRIVYFCLDHGITDLDIVNDLLYEKSQKCIGVIG